MKLEFLIYFFILIQNVNAAVSRKNIAEALALIQDFDLENLDSDEGLSKKVQDFEKTWEFA